MIYCGIQTRSQMTTLQGRLKFEAQGRGREKVLVHLQEEGNLSSQEDQKRSLGRRLLSEIGLKILVRFQLLVGDEEEKLYVKRRMFQENERARVILTAQLTE